MFTANDLAQHRTALEAALYRPPVIDLARQVARRRDEQLVAIIANALAPWPVRVFVLEHRPGVIRVVLGRPDGAYLDVPIDDAQLLRLGPDEVARYVAVEARRRWVALEPLPVPANITLGQE